MPTYRIVDTDEKKVDPPLDVKVEVFEGSVVNLTVNGIIIAWLDPDGCLSTMHLNVHDEKKLHQVGIAFENGHIKTIE